MRTVDVSSKSLFEMARYVKKVPTNLSCQQCRQLVAGLLPDNKPQNFIYGVIIPHNRIVCGIHKEVIYIPHEEIICLCEECSFLLQKISHIMRMDDASHLPINGGHFVTISKLKRNGDTINFSRFQGNLNEFRKIMSLIKS